MDGWPELSMVFYFHSKVSPEGRYEPIPMTDPFSVLRKKWCAMDPINIPSTMDPSWDWTCGFAWEPRRDIAGTFCITTSSWSCLGYLHFQRRILIIHIKMATIEVYAPFSGTPIHHPIEHVWIHMFEELWIDSSVFHTPIEYETWIAGQCPI